MLIKMLVKFAIVGLSGVGVNMAVYIPLTNFGCHYLLAAICSFLAAVSNNFLWNMLWTFRGRASEKSVSSKYITFFVISIVNLGVNLVILQSLVEVLSIREAIAQLGAIAITSVFNFTLNYLITFAERREKQNSEVAQYETGYHPNL